MIWLTGHLVIVVVLAVGFLLAVIVTQQRRSPQSSLAWLLAFVLLPYASIPLFLFLGFRKKRALGMRVNFDQPANCTTEAQSPVEEVFAASSLPPALSGHDFTLLDTPKNAHQAIFQTIEKTRRDLWVSFYIVSNDPEGRAFLAALTNKARAGVNVCLLLDWLGAFAAPRSALRDFQNAGGALRYAATPHVRWSGPSLNLRNHRKMIISDGALAFSGGMNVGTQYMSAAPNDHAWVDLSFTLRGPAISTFAAVFRADWLGSGPPDDSLSKDTKAHSAIGTTRAQLVPSGPGIGGDPLHDGLVHAIHCARDRVWLASPYYLPSDGLNDAILSACKRGVDVIVMTPATSNQRLTDWARGPYLHEVYRQGGKIILHPWMLHAKMGLIDETSWVGSANFDMRSMLLNYELALFVSDTDTVNILAAWFEKEATRCQIMQGPPTRFQQLFEGFFRLLAPVL